MNWIYFVLGTLVLVPVTICLVKQFMEIVGLGLGALGMLLLFAGNFMAAFVAVLLALVCSWQAAVTVKKQNEAY